MINNTYSTTVKARSLVAGDVILAGRIAGETVRSISTSEVWVFIHTVSGLTVMRRPVTKVCVLRKRETA